MLTHERVDARQLVLVVRAGVRIPGDRQERHAPFAFPHRVLLAAQIGEREPEEDVQLVVVWCVEQLLLEGDTGRIGICLRARLIAAERVGLGEHEAPSAAVAERIGIEPDEEALLRVVQSPDQVPVRRRIGRELRRLHTGPYRSEHRPGAGQVSPGELDHCPALDAVDARRIEGEDAVVRRGRLGIAPEPEQRARQSDGRRHRAGVERLRPGEMLERRLPAPERLLDVRRGGEQIGVRWRAAQPGRVDVQGLRRVVSNERVIVAEG